MTKHISLTVLVLALSAGCSKSDPQAAEAEAEGQAKVLGKAEADTSIAAKLKALVPRLGGSLLAFGDHGLELAIHANGLVEGLLYDGDGKVVAKPDKTELKVHLRGEGEGQAQEVALKWDDQSERFVGRADAKADLVPKPVKVSGKVDGKAQSAELSEYALLPTARFGGNVLGAGTYNTELIARPDGHVQAFVTDQKGAQVEGSAKTKLKAKLGAKGDREVDLAWDPKHRCFAGKVDSKAQLAAEPVEVALDVDGQSHVGGLAKLTPTVDASHDGSVVVAGDFPVELKVDGKVVEAHVFDAAGKARAEGDLDLKLFAGGDADGAIDLEWHAPSACYRGKIDTKLDLSAQPIRVELIQSGRLHAGAALSLAAVADARFDADGKVGADAELGAELPDVDAKAELAANANGNAKAQANANAKAKASANAKSALNGDATAKLAAKAPKVEVSAKAPKVDVKKSASVQTGSGAKGEAKAGIKAGFSLGTK